MMSKNYLIFWWGLIVVSLLLGGGCLGLFAKYKYAEDNLDIDTRTLTILSLNISGDELTFTSDYNDCTFNFRSLEKVEIVELKKISTPSKAKVTFIHDECSQVLDAIIVKFNGLELGTMSVFNEKNNNMANLYMFFSALCISVAIVSFFMLKVTAWIIRKQAAIE